MRVPNPSNNWISRSLKDFKNATLLVFYCCHTKNLVCLKQHKCILYYVTVLKGKVWYMSLWAKIMAQQGFIAFWGLWGEIYFFVFRDHLHSLANGSLPPPSKPGTASWILFISLLSDLASISNLFLWLMIPLSTFKDHWITQEPPT